MSKRVLEPIYFHQGQPVLVKLGAIMGRDVFIQLEGDVERREHDYLRVLTMIKELFNPPHLEIPEDEL